MRRAWLWHIPALTLLVGLLFLCVLCVVFASIFADVAGCQVDEARPQPCIVAGRDWGGLLATVSTIRFLLLVTAPIILVSLLPYAPIVLRWWRQRRDAS